MLQKVLCFFLCVYSFEVAANDTILKLYRPYGEITNQVSPQVKKTLKGACYSQSKLIVREDAWRCIAEGMVYDPCFVKAGPNRTQALCPHSPWSSDSVVLMVKRPLNNEHHKTLDMSRTYPWAIELKNGEQCLAIHSSDIYDNMPVRYQCGQQRYLIGYLQRCKPVWSILEKNSAGVSTVELKKAWF